VQMRLVLIFCGLGTAVWSYARWRQAVRVALLLVILEGAIRKWLFPGAQEVVYFAKDLLLFGAYCGWLMGRGGRPLPRLAGLKVPLLLGALYGLIEIFNPRLPNPLVGIFGFKAYFFYAPLLFVFSDAFDSDRELARFLKRYALTAIPVGLLAVAQFFSSPSSPLNTYARAVEDVSYISTFGNSTFVRVTATFSYITGYSSYLIAAAILLLGILAATQWQFRKNLAIYCALAMTMLGILLTGSRGPLLLLAAVFPLYWWLAVARERGAGAIFSRLILAAALMMMFLSYGASDAVDAYLGRASESEDVRTRLLAPFYQPFDKFAESGLFGFGIGATHQTAAAVVKDQVPYSWLRGLIVEDETGRVMIELGPLGFALVFWVRIYLSLLAFRYARRLRTRFHRAMATACLLFFVSHLPAPVVFDVTADVYYWFFAGLLILVARLDRETAAAAVPQTVAARSMARQARIPTPAAVSRRRTPELPALEPR
jgi:hypothetical protein